jgi:tRNA modification GTPase
MFSTTDTIVAIATPPGRGGIGVVRVSGPSALALAGGLTTHARPLEPRLATHTYVRSSPDAGSGGDLAGRAGRLDEIVATWFPAPRSYTGEDVVELSAHGSPVVLQAIVTAAIARGARLAEPGEFTLRAFLNGRLDLPQAEAVADLIEAVTPLQARVAFDQLQGTLSEAVAALDAALFDLVAKLEASIDFPDEGYHFVAPGTLAAAIADVRADTQALLADARRGRMVRDGLSVAIVGEPNVGKSSLFNALVGASRAIVTGTPGTTRDLVTEVVDLEGVRVTLVDTAGRREARDEAEQIGVMRAAQAAAVADLVLVVMDATAAGRVSNQLGQITESRQLMVLNKIDLIAAPPDGLQDAIAVSARSGEGLAELRRAIVRGLDVDPSGDPPAISNLRHATLVERADRALGRALEALAADQGLPEEFVLADLQDAREALEEITGRRAPDDLLAHIFARFCIGK